jgi:hypothetical protein
MKKLSRKQLRKLVEGSLKEVTADFDMSFVRQELKLASKAMDDVHDCLNNARNELMSEDESLEAEAERLFRKAYELQGEINTLLAEVGLALVGGA